MSDTMTHDELGMDRPLTEAMRENRAAGDLIPFGDRGLTPQSFTQVVDWAKLMSKAAGVVGPALIGNPGACLAIIELGQKFKFSPYMLARGCYSVNGVLAFDGQTVSAIMNRHMPLEETADGKKTRLKYRYEGETLYETVDDIDERTGVVRGKKKINTSTLKVFVTGQMKGEADILEYESPMIKDIKNRNSPLWEEDPKQQLRYFASRRWQRAHWPEGLLGIYDTEDAAAMQHVGFDNAKLIEADKPGAGMLERIKAARAHTSSDDRIVEGFTKDHAHNETNGFSGDVHATGAVTVGETITTDGEVVGHFDNFVKQAETAKPKSRKKTKESPETFAERKATAAERKATSAITGTAVKPKDDEPEHEVLPKNAQQWAVWTRNWITALPAAELDKRWAEERRLRNECGVIEEVRAPLYEILLAKRDAAT